MFYKWLDVNENLKHLIIEEYDEDNLITYREFMNAVKGLDSLYKSILPRTLSFQ